MTSQTDGPASQGVPDPKAAPEPEPGYQERLTPAPWIWISVLLLAAGFGIAFAKLDDTAGLVAFLLATAVFGGLLVRWTPVVAVRDGRLVAGRATIPLALTGPAQVLDDVALRHEAGPGLNARAYLCLRGWIPTGVRIPLTDPDDPTPYWLVSSRRPAQLAAALQAGRPLDGTGR